MREGKRFKILVDADACPVISIVERVAEKYSIPVILLCDTSHVLYSDYSEINIIDVGIDAVDFALIKRCNKGDIVVTQDYGVANMILGKGAYGIHQSGRWYTDINIGPMMMERHYAKRSRSRKNRGYVKGHSKRTEADNKRFEESFEKLILSVEAGKKQ